jgi:hypothetical protein
MEIRATQEGKAKKLVGYAARYNKVSGDIPDSRGGTFREKIMRGAFDDAIKADHSPRTDCNCRSCGIACLLNHDPDKVLGRVGAGTLKLASDDKGLRFECTLPDTSYAEDLYESVRQGNMGGCSFAFSTSDVEDRWDETYDSDEDERSVISKIKKGVLRIISRFRKLLEVSVVTFPAYGGTSVSARSLAAATELRARLGLAPTLNERLNAFETKTTFKRNPGLAEDAGRRTRALHGAIHLPPTWPDFDANALVEVILEARKLAAKPELNTIEHRRFWFCVHAVTAVKEGMTLSNLENDYRNDLLVHLGPAPLPSLGNRFH